MDIKLNPWQNPTMKIIDEKKREGATATTRGKWRPSRGGH